MQKLKIIIFLDGTILDDRAILYLVVTNHKDLYLKRLSESVPVDGAVEFCKKIYQNFDIFYFGAEGKNVSAIYQKWLNKYGFPAGKLLTNGYKTKLPSGINFAVDDRIQDGEDFYPKYGITFIPVNEYCARWDKVLNKLLIVYKSVPEPK